MSEALTFAEKEPASGRESHRSDAVRTQQRRTRRSRKGRVVDQGESGGNRGAPDAVRTHRTQGSVSGWRQDGWRYVRQSQDVTSIRRYVLIRDQHSDVPGVRRTGRTGCKVLFLLMNQDGMEDTGQKGIKRVLEERGLWPDSGDSLLLECPKKLCASCMAVRNCKECTSGSRCIECRKEKICSSYCAQRRKCDECEPRRTCTECTKNVYCLRCRYYSTKWCLDC